MRKYILAIAILSVSWRLPAAGAFSTFLQANSSIIGVSSDAAGNIYVLGSAHESPIPGRASSGFVMRLDAAATKVAYLQYLGGSSGDGGAAIAVDAAGNAYIAGVTFSSDFPATFGSSVSATPNHSLPFVMKLNPAGDVLFASVYESQVTAQPQAIALDAAGNIVLTGRTVAGYPSTKGAASSSDTTFVTKLDPTGTSILFSAVGIGGSHLALGSQGEIYVSGNGNNATPTTPGALQTSFVPSSVCDFPCQLTFPAAQQYVSKLSADGSQLIYSTFLTAFGGAINNGLVVDSAGNAYVTGESAAAAYPYTDQLNSSSRKGEFLTKLDPTGSRVVWSVRQGGEQLVMDANGNLAVGGSWGPGPPQATFGLIVYPLPVPAGDTPVPCLANQLLARNTAFVQHFSITDGSLLTTQVYPGTYVTPTAIGATGDGRILLGGNSLLPDVPLTAGTIFDAGGVAARASEGAFLAAFDGAGTPMGGALTCVMDAVGGNISGPVAPGELISLMGKGFGPATPVAGTITGPGNVAATLGGVTVTFDGLAAPLLYVADNQINVSVPFEVTNKTSTLVKVSFNGTPVATRQLAVVPSNPVLFTDQSNLTLCAGQSTVVGLGAMALNSDGTHNTCTNRAKPGSTVTLFLNGVNAYVGTTPATGSVLGPNPLPLVAAVDVRTAGTSLASGPLMAWPGVIAGVYELNVTLPSDLRSSGEFGLYVTINGLAAGPLTTNNPQAPFQGMVWVGQ
jgi:uncharacterized protein (TIGR03437 family)